MNLIFTHARLWESNFDIRRSIKSGDSSWSVECLGYAPIADKKDCKDDEPDVEVVRREAGLNTPFQADTYMD